MHAERLLARDPDLALAQVVEILRVVPNEPRALHLLGEAEMARGQFERACGVLQLLVAQHPHAARAHLSLGRALARAGHGEAAIQALRRAAHLKADLPGVWLALGDHLAAIGDQAGAEEAYAKHVRHSTRDPRLVQAAIALADNEIPTAERLLREHLKQAPTDVAAIRMLAEVAARLARHDDAEVLLARCLQLAPDFHEARQNYALVLHRANKPERALAEIEPLLARDPSNPSTRNLKAVLLCRIGDYEPALKLYAGILEEYPNQAKIWLSYGHALKTAGHGERAVEAYRRCIALEPSFGEAWWSLANLKTYRFSAEDIATLRERLNEPKLSDEDRLHFDFALGKALEDAREYADAFAHYDAANRLRRELVPYSADDNSARMRRARALFDEEFFHQRRGFGAPDRDPIFVVGLPRSGSTLVEQILASHSAVEGTMELPEIISIARGLRGAAETARGTPYFEALARTDAEHCRQLGERYIEHTRIQRRTAAPRFVDKMPNNFAHIALIHSILPNARIVDVRRHPMACCWSGFKQHFARGQNFSYSLTDLGRYYADYVALMAHYDRVLPGRVHRVIYEDLVADTENQVRALLDYCELPFEEGCLRFHENARPVRTASSEQVRRPINRDGIDQWRHFEPWLGPLRSALGRVLDTYPAAPEYVGDAADFRSET